MQLMQVKDLHKKYYNKDALCGLEMNIEKGKIIGLLGPNGSGKTTLLKTIAGLLTPDSGEIIYPNGAKRGVEAKKTISFLPDNLTFPSWMKVKDAFLYYSEMFPDYSEKKALNMVDILELDMHSAIKRLSKGMQERVALALTFSREASLYLLDEPLGGIDPVGKRKVLDTILSMDIEDSSILLSTHLVKDVEMVFDSFFIIVNGKIVFYGDSEALRQESGKTAEEIYLEVVSNA